MLLRRKHKVDFFLANTLGDDVKTKLFTKSTFCQLAWTMVEHKNDRNYNSSRKNNNNFKPIMCNKSMCGLKQKHTCIVAVNCGSFSMVSSAAPFWTVVRIDVLKKYLQFWWSIWYSSSNISALTSGEGRWKTRILLSLHSANENKAVWTLWHLLNLETSKFAVVADHYITVIVKKK